MAYFFLNIIKSESFLEDSTFSMAAYFRSLDHHNNINNMIMV